MVVRFCKSFFFLCVSLITIGAAVAAFGILLAVCVKYKLKEVSSGLFTYTIVGLVVSICVFILALIMSVKKLRALWGILSTIFLIFALGILCAGIIGFVFKKKILDGIADVWNVEKKWDGRRAIMKALEQSFNCCSWDILPPRIDTLCENMSVFWKKRCKGIIDKDYDNYANYGFGGLIGFGLLLSIAMVVGFYISCSKTNIDYEALNLESSAGKDWYTDPKNGNAAGEKKSQYQYAW
jgi:hypothetical protein